MFVVNKDDMSIYCTRGDSGTLYVSAEKDGIDRVFKAKEVVRFKVFSKKDCGCVVLQKEVVVGADTTSVPVYLSGAITKFGDLISKPVDYWYEVEVNPYTVPETIIGYDDDGPKLFRLYPEGKDITDEELPDGELPEGVVDDIIAEALIRAKETGMFDGADGQDGKDGADGAAGADGYTPQKGVDYYTEADKEELVQLVLDGIPYYAGEVEDAS